MQWRTNVRRTTVRKIVRLAPRIVLEKPPPGDAWQEPIELSLALTLMDYSTIVTITEPIRTGFAHNFMREGSQAGPWEPLADWTKSERMELMSQSSFFGTGLVPGFSAEHPILQRTGEYRATWIDKSNALSGLEIESLGQVSRTIMVGSRHEHAGELSFGEIRPGGGRLPARPVHYIDPMYEQALDARITAVLTKYVQQVKPP